MKLLVYGLGGGLGHLTRAISLARAASIHGHTTRILSNSEFVASAECERVRIPGAEVVSISPLDPIEVQISTSMTEITASGANVLVVDTFPRGLYGELESPGIDVPRALVARDLTPRYARQAAVANAARRFDLRIEPGEPGPWSRFAKTVRTAPWLIRDDAELLTREASRVELGLARAERPSILIMATGTASEVAESMDSGREIARSFDGLLDVRVCAPRGIDWPDPSGIVINRYPIFEWMRAFDLVVGSGAYHTVHETKAAGLPLIAFPRTRLYDRQRRRLRKGEIVHTKRGLLTRIGRWIRTWEPNAHRPLRRFSSGAHEAVRELERLVKKSRRAMD